MRRWLAVSMLALALSACGEPSVEVQVKAAIEAMEEHGEAGERGAFMDYVAEDFQGQGGQLGREDFARMLAFQWSRNARIHAQVFPVEVTELGPNLATARFRVLLTGGQGWLPERGQLFRVDSSWRKEGGEWRLWRLDWAADTF